jgi:hypothetical protein
VCSIPIVPLPPIFILPKRRNGTESVVMVLGTTSRMTMTFSGSFGMSLSDMARKYVKEPYVGVRADDAKSVEAASSVMRELLVG